MLESAVINLLISILLGAAIGLERQSVKPIDSENPAVSGMRTFALVALAGCLSGIFYANNFPLVFVFMAAGSIILVSLHFYITATVNHKFGFTTELAFIMTFLLGATNGTGVLPLQITIAIAVVMILILSLKSRSKRFLSAVNRREVESFIIFALLALVILPFLSNQTITLANVPIARELLGGMNVDSTRFENLELLNPRKLWFIVVLITGIDILGYVLSKFVGKERGFTFTSFVGGFISSTLTTQSLAQKSKNATDVNYLVGAAVLANLASFFQIFLLVGPLNAQWLVAILPTVIVMILTAAAVSIYFLRLKKNNDDGNGNGETEEPEDDKIFSIIPALKFAVILSAIKIITSLCLILFGKAGFIVSSIIASFAGIDAIVINLAGMAGNSITFSFALFTFILVNATNLLAKTFYCYLQGSREFTMKFLVSVLIIIASSFVGLLFV